MSDRIANIIVLAEDEEHRNLVRRYLIRAGREPRCFRFEALPGNRGSGSQYVREQYPQQVVACGGIVGRKTSCLLIVVTDADNLAVPERERTLQQELVRAGTRAITMTEPVVILIPKWQVEAWIKCLLGEAMLEEDQRTDQPPVTASQISQASGILFDWARPNAQVGATCVQSLRIALPRWLRVG